MEQEIEDRPIDYKFYIRKILPKWWMFVVGVAIALAYAHYQNRYQIPQSCSNATVVLKKKDSPQNYTGLSTILPSFDVQNEIEIFKSYNLARIALSQVDFETSYYRKGHYGADRELYKSMSPFRVEYDRQHSQVYNQNINVTFTGDDVFKINIGKSENYTTGVIGQWIETDNFKFRLMPYDTTVARVGKMGDAYYFKSQNLESLVPQYSARLIVSKKNKNGTIVRVGMVGEVPEKTDDYINAITQAYLTYSLEEKNRIVVKTIQFIDTLLVTLSDSLAAGDASLLKFSNSLDVIFRPGMSEVTGTLKEGRTEMQQIALQESYYQYVKEQMELYIGDDESLRPDLTALVPPSLAGITDERLNGYLNQINAQLAERNVLDFSVRDGKNMKPYQFNDYQTREIIRKLLIHIDLASNMLEKRKKEINSKMSQMRGLLTELPATEREKQKITKKYDLNNDLYNYLFRRRYEAGISAFTNQPDAEIIDRATWITRSYVAPIGAFPTSKAIVIGLIIPAVIIALLILLDNKISEVSEIERATGLTPLGTIGENRHKSQTPVITAKNSSIAEAYRGLRTNLQYVDPDQEHKVVVLTSTLSGEGKTFNAVNLALITATNNKKVLLVGLDLRKPRLQEYFNLPNTQGMSTYLSHNSEIEDIITKKDFYRDANNTIFDFSIDIALPGPIPPNPAELIGSTRMQQFIDTLRPKYDYIIIDSAPVGIVTDAILLNNFTSCYLFVIRQKYSQKSVLKLFNDLKNNNNLHNLNIVFNGIKRKGSSYAYGSKYGYGYTGYYGSYYGGYYSDEKTEDRDSLKYKIKHFFKKLFFRRKKKK